MIYIDFKSNPWDYAKILLIREYLKWLKENAGIRGKSWDSKIDDLVIQGAYFEDEATALVFKLTFGL